MTRTFPMHGSGGAFRLLEVREAGLECRELLARSAQHRGLHVELLPGHEIELGQARLQNALEVLLQVAPQGHDAFRDGALTARESRGRLLFSERCATCHGASGRGDGQNAFNLQPPPPDFASSLGELPVADRRRVIALGTAALGRSALCPPRGSAVDGDDVDALLAWLDAMARQTPEEEAAAAPGRRRWRRPGAGGPGDP